MPISKDKNLKYYNENAEDYHERNKDIDLRPLYQAFEKHLSGKRILDFGCGTGRDAAYFSSKGYDVLGLDFSEEMLKIARKSAPKAGFVKMDLTDDLAPLGMFDGVWAMASLLHLNPEQFEVTIFNLNKILRKEAPLFISIKQEDFYESGDRDFYYWDRDTTEHLFEKIKYGVEYFSETKTERNVFLNWVLTDRG